MRKINVIKGDIKFQWKYGFYLLYVLVILVYMILFSFFGGGVKNIIVACCVYSDPAAMGMFFMGAMILLEKSQRITDSIAISPVTPEEYILGKMVSFVFISEIVGLILLSQGHTDSFLLGVMGIMMASILFSLCGVIVGTMVDNLNQYIVGTIPFEIIGFLPVIAYRIGYKWDSPIMILHPGCAAMQLIEGKTDMLLISVVSLMIWNGIIFLVADQCVRKMYKRVGGGKL